MRSLGQKWRESPGDCPMEQATYETGETEGRVCEP
jgi:hypothetical protein